MFYVAGLDGGPGLNNRGTPSVVRNLLSWESGSGANLVWQSLIYPFAFNGVYSTSSAVSSDAIYDAVPSIPAARWAISISRFSILLRLFPIAAFGWLIGIFTSFRFVSANDFAHVQAFARLLHLKELQQLANISRLNLSLRGNVCSRPSLFTSVCQRSS